MQESWTYDGHFQDTEGIEVFDNDFASREDEIRKTFLPAPADTGCI